MNMRPSIKHLVVIVLFVVAFGLIGQVNAAELNTYSLPATSEAVATVNTGALNVRSGPSVSFSAISVVYQGQVVTLLGRHATNNWVKIRLYSGTEGWVNSAYLITSVPVSSLPVIGGTAPPPPSGYNAVVATGALNVRSGPSIAYPSIAVVPSGQPVQLLARNSNGSWVKIQTTIGVVGWVNASYLYSNVPIFTLPVEGAPTTQPIATVTTGALNVRSGPSPIYNVVVVVGQGQTVTLLGRNADATWVQVRAPNGVVGWANAYYLTASTPIYSLPVVGAGPPESAAVVSVGALNVRYGPGTSYGSFAVIYRGTPVGLVGRNASSTWVQIRLPNAAVGWVNANYLQGNIAVASLPITG